MALIAIKRRSDLAAGLVLAPERYDPRRELPARSQRNTLLGEIAQISRRTVQPTDSLGPCLVLDTSDAKEGLLAFRKQPIPGANIGSVKKVIEPGQVIISRLRPYLRQVAWVDPWLPIPGDALLLCSTEFFVLSGMDGRSIAFLVPFLLTEAVQAVLSASQEGGHHPRFAEGVLLDLPIPDSLLDTRDQDSTRVEECVRLFRESEASLARIVQDHARLLSGGSGGRAAGEPAGEIKQPVYTGRSPCPR